MINERSVLFLCDSEYAKRTAEMAYMMEEIAIWLGGAAAAGNLQKVSKQAIDERVMLPRRGHPNRGDLLLTNSQKAICWDDTRRKRSRL